MANKSATEKNQSSIDKSAINLKEDCKLTFLVCTVLRVFYFLVTTLSGADGRHLPREQLW